jgi:hypothetical protein
MRYTLDEITAERLTSLIGTRAEDKHIEYKQELPGKDDKAKAEFLKDATAFANTDGGDIIYGMAEVKGTASKFFPVENRAIDDAKNQLHQILDNGVTPRIPPVDIQPIEIEPGKSVLVVRIPASHLVPHQVTAAHSYRFYGRNTAGTYVIEVDKLRNKILRQASLPERMNDFRRSRVDLIRNHPEDMPSPIEYECKLVVHYMPEQTLGRTGAVDAALLTDPGYRQPVVANGSPTYAPIGISYRSNIEGYVFMNGLGDDALQYYVQTFYDGTVEFADGAVFRTSATEAVIYHETLEQTLFRQFDFARRIFTTLGVDGRVAIYATALGMRDFTIKPQAPTRDLDFVKHSTAIGRDPAFFNPVIIEDVKAVEAEEVLEPLVQQFWRAAAYDHAYSYKDGKYVGRNW